MLRPVEPRDMDCLAAIRADLALQHLLLANPDPAQAHKPDVQGWIARRQTQGWFQVIANASGDAVGFAQISQIHRKNAHGWMGIALLATARGKGLGRAAITALQGIAAGDLGLRKLMIEVRADNAGALTLYQSLGFRVVGTLIDHYNDGTRLHDVLVCEWLAPKP